MTNHTKPSRAGLGNTAPSRAGLVDAAGIRCRLLRPAAPWHTVHARVAGRKAAGPFRVAIQLDKEVTLELSHAQAVELINRIADTLEGR